MLFIDKARKCAHRSQQSQRARADIQTNSIDLAATTLRNTKSLVDWKPKDKMASVSKQALVSGDEGQSRLTLEELDLEDEGRVGGDDCGGVCSSARSSKRKQLSARREDEPGGKPRAPSKG